MSGDYYAALSQLCQPIRTVEYPRSLRPLQAWLAALRNPQTRFPAIVVAGSVGKGTTAWQIARFAAAQGMVVGLYSSPHLHSFRERLMIDDAMISQEVFASGVKAIMAARPRSHVYSTFEMATVLALWWFVRHTVDMAVLEVGIGGRWDAVNVVDNSLAVITPIEAEHQILLGGSLQSIAWRKAGIIQPGGRAVSAQQDAEILRLLQHEATLVRAHLDVVPEGGSFFASVKRAMYAAGLLPGLSAATGDLAQPLPARLEEAQIEGQTVLIDGAHTRLAANYLREKIAELTDGRVRLIVGMLQDKRASDFLRVFDTPQFHIVLTTAPGHRARAAEDLAVQFTPTAATLTLTPDRGLALEAGIGCDESLTVVAGSLRMAAAAREAYGLLDPEMLQEAHKTRAIFEGGDYLSRLPPTHPVE